MAGVFHKEDIFNQPDLAWERYKKGAFCPEFPERITVDITNRCNLQCFMCPRNKVKMELGDIDFGLFKKIIDEASGYLPVSLVPFFRWEPLLHNDLIEMLNFASAKGLKPIQLATNAFFLKSELSERILDSGIDFITFSIDVNVPGLYKKIRINSDFERVFSNIVNFIELKKKKGLTLPEIQVSAVKTKDSSPFIVEFINFWKDKVDKVRIYPVHSLDTDIGKIDSASAVKTRKPCLKLLTDMVIYWNGDVAICNHDWQRNFFIGNVKNSSLKDIWQNGVYQDLRKRHLDNNLKDVVPCNYCSHWQAYYQKNKIIGELYEKN